MEVKFLQLEGNFKASIEEKSKHLQELHNEITKLKCEEDNLRRCYDGSLKQMREATNLSEKEHLNFIAQKIDKVNELSARLESIESRCDDLKNSTLERLLLSQGRFLEQELKHLRDSEIRSMQNLESNYAESMQHHELRLQESKKETAVWKEEFDHKQKKCMDLERKLLDYTNIEAENRHLRESLMELKDQNEKIQKVVATLRVEMESLQNATSDQNHGVNNEISSDKEIEMELAKDLREELQALKSKISRMSSKLNELEVNRSGGARKQVSCARESMRNLHKSGAVSCSDEEMPARLAELEQKQAILKSQLETTIANAARIADERDILMELNNSLHAELNRSMQCLCGSQHPHTKEGKRKLDACSCHDCTCLERCGGQQCCSKECSDIRLPSESRPESQDQKPTMARNKLHVEGSVAKYHDRASAIEDVLHKGTASQHANLKYLVRRGQEVFHANKPKVRNYNIKDDM